MISRIIFPPFLGGRAALGLVVIRLAAGLAMMFHGWPKIQNAFAWMGEGADVPGWLQAAAAAAEFGGGACWILGLLTPLFSLLVLCTMAVALGMVHLPQNHPFVAQRPDEHGYELAVVYGAVSILLILAGPGKLSADALLFGRPKSAAP